MDCRLQAFCSVPERRPGHRDVFVGTDPAAASPSVSPLNER